MIGKLFVAAIIPARGGSKGLPGKNIAKLRGRPLLAYTIEAALKSRYIDRVIVSTDDEKIAEISRRYGAETPFKRPAYLSLDTTHTPPVIEHAARFVEKRGYTAHLIVTLQPTSPLRTASQIDRAVRMLYGSRFGSVMSVKSTEFPPYWTVRVKSGRAEPFVHDGTDYFKKERQQLPKTYQPNGAIYVTRRESLFREKAVISKNCGVIIMDETTSMDIDTREDLKKIEDFLEEKFKEGRGGQGVLK